jgi:Flp pilus assembly protein TadB
VVVVVVVVVVGLVMLVAVLWDWPKEERTRRVLSQVDTTIPTQEISRTVKETLSPREEVRMSDITSLTQQVQQLGTSAAWWSNASTWLMGAIATCYSPIFWHFV